MGLRQDLAARLDNSLQTDSKRSYVSGVRAFLKFLDETDELGQSLCLPLRPIDYCLYTEWLLQRYAPGTVKNYRNHLSFCFEACGLAKPDWKNIPYMPRIMRGVNARALNPKRKKMPITARMAYDIANMCDLACLDDLICCIVLLTGICGLFRLGELLIKNKKEFRPERLLRRDHIEFVPDREHPTHMEIFLQYSKCDKYGVGITVYIPCNPNRDVCPVLLMRRWLSRFSSATDPIFVWPSGQLMTTASFIRWLRRMLSLCGYDDSLYAGHSLRRGGAVTAKAAGASDPLIQTLGRWTSDAFKIYLRLIHARVMTLNSLLVNMGLMQ